MTYYHTLTISMAGRDIRRPTQTPAERLEQLRRYRDINGHLAFTEGYKRKMVELARLEEEVKA